MNAEKDSLALLAFSVMVMAGLAGFLMNAGV